MSLNFLKDISYVLVEILAVEMENFILVPT